MSCKESYVKTKTNKYDNKYLKRNDNNTSLNKIRHQQKRLNKEHKKYGRKILHTVDTDPKVLQSDEKMLARLQCGNNSLRKPHKSESYSHLRRRLPKKRGNVVFRANDELLFKVHEDVKNPEKSSPTGSSLEGLYKKIESDLKRLHIAREEREKSAAERKASEEARNVERKKFKNIFEVRAAARTEKEALKRERKAAKKKPALEQMMAKNKVLELVKTED